MFIVLALVGVVAAVALPRFIDLSDETHSAKTQGINGVFRVATNLVRTKWIANGSAGNTVDLGSGVVTVTFDGWPGHDIPPSLSQNDCLDVWNGILEDPPSAAAGFPVANVDWAVLSGGSLCAYI